MSHHHYDEAQDRRWACQVHNCLLHDVAPAPIQPPPEPSPLAQADVLAAAILDGVLPPFELERMAQRYFLARKRSLLPRSQPT
jgi:hypothetical protein